MRSILSILLLFCSFWSMGQQASQGTVEYDKAQVPCYVIEMPYAPSVAEDAVKERFKKMGVNGKERKDFWEFRNVMMPELRDGLVDAYIKIERKSRKEKDISIVSLILTEPGIAPGSSDSLVMAARGTKTQVSAVGAMGLLSSLKDNTEDYSLELEIKRQEDEVKKADRKYNDLMDDGNDLQKKLKRLQDDIENNKKKQAQQSDELKKQKEVLQQMQARRRKPAAEKKTN